MPKFSRRQLLRGVAAGTALASVAPLRRVLASDTGPCRFLFVLEGNGFEPRTVLSPQARLALDDGAVEGGVGSSRWWYRRYRHDTPLDIATPDLGLAPGLAGLAEFGLQDRATAILGLSSRVVGGGHSAYHGALSSTRTLSNRAGGATIDAHLAALSGVRGATPFDAIRMAVTGGALNFGACAVKAGLSVPMIGDPEAAYNLLYGAFGGDAERSFERQSRLLAFLDADVQAAIVDERLPLTEATKLEVFGASIADLQLTQERLRAMSVTPPPVPETGLAPIAKLGAHLDVATSALIDGLTNVAVVGSGIGGGFSLNYSSVSPVGRHDMHHGSARDPVLSAAIATVTQMQFREIARVARRLQDTPEPGGEGSMLDHTVIVFVGDNGEQHHSTASEFPVVLLGGQAGLAAGGRTLVYPRMASAGHRQLSNLWNTLGYSVGEALDEFGGEGALRRAAGPLGELFG